MGIIMEPELNNKWQEFINDGAYVKYFISGKK